MVYAVEADILSDSEDEESDDEPIILLRDTTAQLTAPKVARKPRAQKPSKPAKVPLPPIGQDLPHLPASKRGVSEVAQRPIAQRPIAQRSSPITPIAQRSSPITPIAQRPIPLSQSRLSVGL